MKDILYCGDTSLTTQASYLAGVMAHSNLKFDYLDSSARFNVTGMRPKLLILSDYPSSNFSTGQLQQIVNWVQNGMSLWMVGGWDSFYGLDGEYKNVLEDVLPVKVSCKDDRLNSYQPIAMIPQTRHPILTGLPWQQCPTVGGLNKVKAKKNSLVLLSGVKLKLQNHGEGVSLSEAASYPLLVCGTHGKGKTLAFMSDVAPHWVGGLVDWGGKRMTLKGPKARQVEVGSNYLKFLANCVNYLLDKPSNP